MSDRTVECGRVPSVCRRIVALLVVACLGAVAHASPALAQGAGDQQYEDPFGGSQTSTTKGSSGSGTSTTPPSGDLQPLSPSPQNAGSGSGSSGSGSSGSGSGSGSSTSNQATPAATAQGLPNTGADARVVLFSGAALLLIGLGLRLRSAPERF
jgi:LPXTG-motif cell wall-anchored protein